MTILPSTLKLLADNKVDTRSWQPDELEYFQTRYGELSKEYIAKLQEPDADGLKAAFALAVWEVELKASEDIQAAASNKLILALEALCNERMKAKVEIDAITAANKVEKVKAEKVFKDKSNRKPIKAQTLAITGDVAFTLKYGDEVATSSVPIPHTASAIQSHLETISSLKGSVTVTGPTDDAFGGKVFEITYSGKLKRNFIPLAVASLDGPGTISLGY